MTTDYERALAALFDRKPGRIVSDLSRITQLLDLLGSPQLAFPSIHITGTNGKTSTARMIDQLLSQLGIRVGRYTSPHLLTVNERISIDGKPVADDIFGQAYVGIEAYLDLIDQQNPEPLTYFEIMTALAFVIFADAPIDVAVVEVGMGGRWDATNVLKTPVAVLTPISLDHSDILGSEIADIASEKADIIQMDTVVISAVQPEAAIEPIFRQIAQVGASIAREGAEFALAAADLAVGGQRIAVKGLSGFYDDIFLPLHGVHQAHNAALAVAAVETFTGAGQRSGAELDADIVRDAFAMVSSPGRLHRLRTSPTIVADGAHNVAGMQATMEAIDREFHFDRLIVVLAVLADKDSAGIINIIQPYVDQLIITSSTSPRALAASQLAANAAEVIDEDKIHCVEALDKAIDFAIELADQDWDSPLGTPGIVITGSLTIVAEATALLGVGVQ